MGTAITSLSREYHIPHHKILDRSASAYLAMTLPRPAELMANQKSECKDAESYGSNDDMSIQSAADRNENEFDIDDRVLVLKITGLSAWYQKAVVVGKLFRDGHLLYNVKFEDYKTDLLNEWVPAYLISSNCYFMAAYIDDSGNTQKKQNPEAQSHSVLF